MQTCTSDMELSYFPIRVQFTDSKEIKVIDAPEQIPNGRGFRILNTNYVIESRD